MTLGCMIPKDPITISRLAFDEVGSAPLSASAMESRGPEVCAELCDGVGLAVLCDDGGR